MFIEKLTDKEIISFLKDVYKNKISEKELNRYKFKLKKFYLNESENNPNIYLKLKIGVKEFENLISDFEFTPLVNDKINEECFIKFYNFMKNKFGEEYINKLNLYYQKEDKQNNEELIK